MWDCVDKPCSDHMIVSGKHYRTFDGTWYVFFGTGEYFLVDDTREGLFSIIIDHPDAQVNYQFSFLDVLHNRLHFGNY